jgi:hypothetical protein
MDGRDSIFKPIDVQAAMDGLDLLPAQRHSDALKLCRQFRRFSAAVATSREGNPLATVKPGSPAPALGPGGWLD